MTWLGLTDDRVLITGGAGSIGRAVAAELVAQGASVAVADMPQANPDGAAAALTGPGSAVGVAVDVTDRESVVAAVAQATKELGGPLTALVTAAGILRTGRIDEMPDRLWGDINEVNVAGTFRALQATLPSFHAAGKGSVVMISSVSAFIGSDGGTAYSATKGAVLSFAYGAAGELAPYGFRVNAVCPGWVDGGFTHEAMRASDDPEALKAEATRLHYLGRMADPQDVANATAFLLSDRASFITGTALFVDGGYMVKH
jgi:NAD(P)-dependent dehydrogenase (short-subunit alcohol dehydrogenase family)